MEIDKMFKVPKMPGGSKRKLSNNLPPELFKRARMDEEDDTDVSMEAPAPQAATKGQKAYVLDEDDEEAASRARGEVAPGGDTDYFVEEDEEGRFFGGGLNQQQKDILNIFDQVSGEGGVLDDPDLLSPSSIRKLLLRFDRAVKKNQDQRSKYPDDPTKFIDSEADLDAAIKSLLPLSQAPSLAYPEMVRSGTVETIVGLLSHENVDIVIDIVELVHELTDEDVGDEDADEEETEGDVAPLKTLIDGLQACSIMELLVDNLSRMNEQEESDKSGIFHTLGIFENIVGFNPELTSHLVAKTSILKWLLARVQWKKQDENRGYAAELLVILLQDNHENRMKLAAMDGVETLLTVLSQYRTRNPANADETEFMENIFDALCSAVSEPELKPLFLKSEGVDLMILMLKEKKDARSRAIKVLDHAMSGYTGTASCETFVEALGLKTLFSVLMGKASKKTKVSGLPGGEETVHILGITSSLLSNLPSDSPARIRVLAKFMEENYEKVDKLLEIREGSLARLAVVDQEIQAEKEEMKADGEMEEDAEEAWYLRRLDNGLFTLQTVDYILAFLAMEDDGACQHLKQMLDRRNKSLQDIVKTLTLYQENVDDDHKPPDGTPSQKEILSGLIAFLEAC